MKMTTLIIIIIAVVVSIIIMPTSKRERGEALSVQMHGRSCHEGDAISLSLLLSLSSIAPLSSR